MDVPRIFCTTLLLAGAALNAAALDRPLDRPLLDAAKRGDRAAVRAVLATRVDVNAADVDGTTALHWAARAGDAALVEELLRAGAQVNVANRYGVRPISLACERGEAAVIEVLLRAGADPNTTGSEGETALMTASRAGTLRGVELLLARGADVNAKETWRGQTALMWAAAEGHADVARMLVAHGADVHAWSNGGFTTLLFAVREGRIDAARVLLDAGASVDESLRPPPRRNAEGTASAAEPGLNALLLAVSNAHFELAAMLLDRGADPNAAPQGWDALHQLSWVRKTGVAGSNDPPPQGSGDMSSLQFARVLVAHGARVNARVTKKPPAGMTRLNMVDGTPFLLAARTADTAYMRLLVELGADPKLPNMDNTTPLMAAAGVGTAAPGEDPGTEPEVLEAVTLALELGNDVNAVDDHGETAMHGAAYKHVPSVVEFLAGAGADINVWNRQNADGRTPLAITIGIPSSMSIIRSATTEAAIRKVMMRLGVTPPAKE